MSSVPEKFEKIVDLEAYKIPSAIGRCMQTNIQNAERQWFVDYLPVSWNNKIIPLVDGKTYGEKLYDDIKGLGKGDVLKFTGLHFDPDWALIRDTTWKVERKADVYLGEMVNQPVAEHTLLNVLTDLIKKGVKVHMIVNQFWKNEVSTKNELIKFIKKQASLDLYMPKTVRLFKELVKLNVMAKEKYGEELALCRSAIHPGLIMGTHHQKTVIINDKICYLGGIDLTAVDGDRWDEHKHQIQTDEKSEIRLTTLPNYPHYYRLWHDVHCRIEGNAVNFVVDNFNARWNHDALFMNHDIKTINGERKLVTDDFIIGEDNSLPKITRPVESEYQRLTRKSNTDCAFDTVHTRGFTHSISGIANSDITKKPGVKIQIVRSMPNGSFAKQKPAWNLNDSNWERSCKDAYLIGIRAARDYIYLENQWIPDEQIWEELLAAAIRNSKQKNKRRKSEFRIICVLPREPLSAAGFGHNSDFLVSWNIERLMNASKDWQFGMYCLEAPIPATRQDLIRSPSEVKAGNRAEIYVHSKIMIVDDKWALIGSANAGGISLEGVTNVKNYADFLTTYYPAAKAIPSRALVKYILNSTTAKDGKQSHVSDYAGDRPDSEIAAIILDDNFAKTLRESLWSEHLRKDVTGMDYFLAADEFDKQAHATNPDKRVRFATDFAKLIKDRKNETRYIPAHLMAQLQRNTRIQPDRADNLVFLEADKVFNFTLLFLQPPNQFEVLYKWRLVDSYGKNWPLAFTQTPRKNLTEFTALQAAAIPQRILHQIFDHYADSTEHSNQIKAVVECEVVVFPLYTFSTIDKNKEHYSFSVEKEIVLARSIEYYQPVNKRINVFSSTYKICHILLETRHFYVYQGRSIKAVFDSYWNGPENCGGNEFSVYLNRVKFLNDTISTIKLKVGQDQYQWDDLVAGEYYITIVPDNTNPYCCLEGEISVEMLMNQQP